MFRFREIKAKTAYQIYALSWSHELPAAEVSEWSSNLAVRWPALQWEPGTLQQAADASSWSSWTFLHAERFEQVHRRFVGTLCVTSGGRHLAMRTTLQRTAPRYAHNAATAQCVPACRSPKMPGSWRQRCVLAVSCILERRSESDKRPWFMADAVVWNGAGCKLRLNRRFYAPLT